MFDQRLPRVNADDGIWGNILLQYLTKEHYNVDSDNAANGGHQKVTIRPGTASDAPLRFTASGAALLTTPVDGAVEYASNTFYITTGSTRKKVAIYDDTSGADGDLYRRDGSGNFIRLPVGSNGQALRVVSGVPAWGSADSALTTTTQSGTTYSVTANDTVVFANAAGNSITISLPSAAASNNGYKFYIKRIDNSSNAVTIDVTGGGTIDGVTSLTIDQRYTSIMVVSNGSAWYIL